MHLLRLRTTVAGAAGRQSGRWSVIATAGSRVIWGGDERDITSQGAHFGADGALPGCGGHQSAANARGLAGHDAYEQFEQVAALLVTALVSVLIAALVHLTVDVLLMVLFGLADPAKKDVSSLSSA